MPSLKTIRKRISTVRSTQQITKAMKMVAAARLRRAQDAAERARPYAQKLAELLAVAAAGIDPENVPHPLLARRDPSRVDLVLVTGDRGLCGGYNANLIRRAEAFVREDAAAQVTLHVVGRKGIEHFRRRRMTMVSQRTGMLGAPIPAMAATLAHELVTRFADGETDAVHLLYARFRSAISQVPTVVPLLPVSPPESGGPSVDYIFEPARPELLGRLLPRYVTTLVSQALLEAAASEQGARMTAMDSATRNAADMIERLTLSMNRARQAGITKELMEIVSGAEALRG